MLTVHLLTPTAVPLLTLRVVRLLTVTGVVHY